MDPNFRKYIEKTLGPGDILWVKDEKNQDHPFLILKKLNLEPNKVSSYLICMGSSNIVTMFNYEKKGDYFIANRNMAFCLKLITAFKFNLINHRSFDELIKKLTLEDQYSEKCLPANNLKTMIKEIKKSKIVDKKIIDLL